MGKGNRTRNNKYQDAYDMSGSGAAVKSVKNTGKKDHTTSIVLIAIVALLAISLIFVVFADTGIKERNTIIVSSDNYEVTGTMMTYYENLAYSNTFSQYFNLYYTYYYPNDISSAYSAAQQMMMSTYTLADFFDSAFASAKEILVLCEAARAAGIELDDDDEATIKETLDSYSGNFSATFGTGVKEKDVRAALELETLAGKYYDKFHEEKTEAVTTDEISKYIEENKADFYATNYLKFDITLASEDYEDAEDAFEKDKALADKYINLIVATKTEKDFKSQVIRYLVDRDFDDVVLTKISADIMPTEAELETIKQDVIADLLAVIVEEKEAEVLPETATALEKAIDAVYKALETTCTEALKAAVGEQAYLAESDSDEIKWLVNSATKQYETKKVDSSDDTKYSTAVYMVTEPLHLEDEETVNVGHILIEAGSTATEEERTKAEAEAKEVLNTYLAGEKTKEAFEKLAEEKTADSGVFYDNVAKGDMVAEFDEWIFSADRKEIGETAIVKTEFGYHVMYWNGKGDNTSVAAAKEGIVGDLYQTFVEEGAKALKINEKEVEKRTAEVETEA